MQNRKNTRPELIRNQSFDIESRNDENHHSRRSELKAETMISISFCGRLQTLPTSSFLFYFKNKK